MTVIVTTDMLTLFLLLIYLGDTEATTKAEGLECPSSNVISTRYRCKVEGHWRDCSRTTCCPKYTYVAGRCVAEDEDPCSLNLCEQKCSVYFGRVICTCFAGYRFNRTLHKIAASAGADDPEVGMSSCEDVDECLDDNGGCQQVGQTAFYVNRLLRPCFLGLSKHHRFLLLFVPIRIRARSRRPLLPSRNLRGSSPSTERDQRKLLGQLFDGGKDAEERRFSDRKSGQFEHSHQAVQLRCRTARAAGTSGTRGPGRSARISRSRTGTASGRRSHGGRRRGRRRGCLQSRQAKETEAVLPMQTRTSRVSWLHRTSGTDRTQGRHRSERREGRRRVLWLSYADDVWLAERHTRPAASRFSRRRNTTKIQPATTLGLGETHQESTAKLASKCKTLYIFMYLFLQLFFCAKTNANMEKIISRTE